MPTAREFESKLRSEGRSEAMVRKVVGSLGSIVADAQERGKVSRNAVREMRGRRKPGKDKRRQQGSVASSRSAWTFRRREEIKAIVGALQGRWRPLILTAIFTGLRASELRGLRWENVDFAKSRSTSGSVPIATTRSEVRSRKPVSEPFR